MQFLVLKIKCIVHTIQDSNVLYSNAAHTNMDESWHFIHRLKPFA